MNYRRLGKTGLMVSEIGFGGEWLDGKTLEEGKALAEKCEAEGINIVDCWMSDPKVRSNLGNAIKNNRPAVIECIIHEDDKVFPMVPGGSPLSDVFDEKDLLNK